MVIDQLMPARKAAIEVGAPTIDGPGGRAAESRDVVVHCTGELVIFWITVARSPTLPPPSTSSTLLVHNIATREHRVRSLTEALDTTIAQARLVLHIFSALAESECSLIRQRTQRA